jgi:DNA-binding beta-propeller fold protein YncE
VIVAALATVAACGSDQSASVVAAGTQVVELPGAEGAIDFDDIVYSSRLNRLIVPARRSGLYLADPRTGAATRVGHLFSADSAVDGEGTIFVADRERRTITAVSPRNGRTNFSLKTDAPLDYVRHVASTRELWVTEPAASPSGIEVFTLAGHARATPRHAGFIPVPGGPEGLTIDSTRGTAYTHAGGELVVIDIRRRDVTARWPSGCRATHGFPQVDDRHQLVLASCASDGSVSLLSLNDGRRLGRYATGGGEALPAYSAATNHFYVRGDPGTSLVTLKASEAGLAEVDEVSVPNAGHCLTADDVGHYWTCDAEHGRVLRFDDPRAASQHEPPAGEAPAGADWNNAYHRHPGRLSTQ